MDKLKWLAACTGKDPLRPTLHRPFGATFEGKLGSIGTDANALLFIEGTDLQLIPDPWVDNQLAKLSAAISDVKPLGRVDLVQLREQVATLMVDFSDCAPCHGEGWVPCKDCSGHNYQCETCQGSGSQGQCDACRGSGVIYVAPGPRQLRVGEASLNPYLLFPVIAGAPDKDVALGTTRFPDAHGRRLKGETLVLRGAGWVGVVAPQSSAWPSVDLVGLRPEVEGKP